MIKVGEYARNKEGKIFKTIDMYYSCIKNIDNEYIGTTCVLTDIGYINKDEIVKHSKNIIDLIEVGDIVHTRDVLEEDYYWMFDEEMIKATRETIESGIELVDILTYEQYKKNTYRLEENK